MTHASNNIRGSRIKISLKCVTSFMDEPANEDDENNEKENRNGGNDSGQDSSVEFVLLLKITI